MTLRLTKRTTPATPASNKTEIFFDTVDNRLKSIDSLGTVNMIQPSGLKDLNRLHNGGMMIQQRIAVASTAIAGISITTRAGVVADRWAVTAGTASNINWQQVDTSGAQEAGLTARYYGSVIAATAAKKHILSQFIINRDMEDMLGDTVRLSAKVKVKVGSSQVIKLGLLQLTSAGTTDVSPAFISAIGADTVDPTYGANLVPITPNASGLDSGVTVVGNYLAITATSSWQRISGLFNIPTNAKNLMVVLIKDTAGGTTDNISYSEVQLFDAQAIRDWVEEPFSLQLIKCQAFYCKTNPYATVPAVGLGANTGEAKGVAGKAGAVANAGFIYWRFPVEMWKTPVTVTLFGPTTTTLVRDETAAVDHSSSVTAGSTTSSTRVTSTGNASTAVGDEIGLHITADSETVN